MPLKKIQTARRIDTSHPALPTDLVNKNPPPTDSFSWKLWLGSQDIAQEALKTDYIQGVANGTLDPNAYGIYNVHDAAYCYYAEGDYKRAEQRAKKEGEDEIAAFAKVRHTSYATYRKEAFDSWGLKRATALVPGAAVQGYIDTERAVATTAPPIYLIVAMIPCDQLWPWLAGELSSKASPTNLYSFWITGNASWHGAYVLDNFVDRWNSEHPGVLDAEKALAIYRACMTGEVNCFRAATGQPLLPLPLLPAF
jgi:thiaminase/transcriptional activator TenA